MIGVLSYSDDRGLALELSRGASMIAATAGGTSSTVVVDALDEAGLSGHVLLLRSDRRLPGDYELIAEALAAAAKANNSSIVLIGATKLGRQIAAKLAVMAGMGVLSDVRI